MTTHISWLDKHDRYIGYRDTWYDGPIPSFGFWFFHVYRLP